MLDTVVRKSDTNHQPACLFNIADHLQLNKQSQFGKVVVKFQQKENAINTSVIQVNDHMRADTLSIRSANDDNKAKIRNLQFKGSSEMVCFNAMCIEESIEEVRFKIHGILKSAEVFLLCPMAFVESEIECAILEAISINVTGRMKCIAQEGESMQPVKITVSKDFQLSGHLECCGAVKMDVDEMFVQKRSEAGSIKVQQHLEIITAENGSVLLEGLTVGRKDAITSLNIDAKNIKVSGNISDISRLELSVDKEIKLTEESRISSCESIDIRGEWITIAGNIDEFLTLEIEPWALLNSGKIDSAKPESNICFSSHLAFVNSGICQSQRSSLEAPFLLSLPGKEISNINNINKCKLEGKESIKLESITCFLGGSALSSEKLVENRSVLLFKFLSNVSCTPDSKSLEAWSKAADSLKSIKSDYDNRNNSNKSEGLFELLKQLITGSTGTSIDLRIAEMYNMVNLFVGDVLQNGIESFNVQRLVFIITSESERYTKINILKEKLLAIPEKARKYRQLLKEKGIKGYKSVMAKFGFDEPKRSNATKGVVESGLYSIGEGATVASQIRATFDELFCDEGFISAGEVIVDCSKEIIMSKREKNAITMRMFASQSIEAGDINANSIDIKSKGKAKLTGKLKADEANIDATNGIDLTYSSKSKWKKTADHEFKKLTLKTEKMKHVQSLLATEGIYEDLKISDRLDLAVTDQDIILSRCNIDQSFQLDLKAKSVAINQSQIKFDKGLEIESKNSLSVNDSKITSGDSAILRSSQGDVTMTSSDIKADNVVGVVSDKGSLSMTAGSVSGDKMVVLKAQKNITIDPIETRHNTSSSKSGFFTSKRQSGSYSTVDKANITSKCGSVNVISEDGSVTLTATEVNAAQDINIIAREDVTIQDKVTTREEVIVKKNWFRTKRKVKRSTESHSSKLNKGGSINIKSHKGSVYSIGTDLKTGKDVNVQAAENVTFKDRILSTYEETHSSGISFSLDKGLSIGSENSGKTTQRLSGCRVDIGGNLNVSAKKFNVQNAMAVDAKNMYIDAKDINFEGAELHNTSYMDKWSIDVGMAQLDITATESRKKEKKVVNQNINIRGRTNFRNAENVNLTASNLNTNAISGQIKNLNVISKQSEIDSYTNEKSIGFTLAGGFPVPNKFGASKSSDVGKFIEKPSGIHCTGSINENEFQVDSLKLKGASVTANGDIGNFAKNIISEKIKSYRAQSSSGFSIGISKQGGELRLHASDKYMAMEHQATIASSNGKVADDIKKNVNTDFSKQAQITAQHQSAYGLNLKVAKDGVGAGIQSNDTSIGFCASKKQVGVHVQKGDKGIALSGGKSGISGSIQQGDNSFGVGFSKKNVSLDLKTKNCDVGTSVGKNGASASVESNGIAMGASTSKGSKSFQAKIGDSEIGLERRKDKGTGEKTTSASAKFKDL